MDEFIFIDIAFELLFGTLPYFSCDLPVSHSGKKNRYLIPFVLLFLILGGVCGMIITLTISPKMLLPYEWMRVANLMVGPLVSGYISYLVSSKRKKSDDEIKPFFHAVYAFVFTLSFVVVRLAFAQK